MSMEDIERLAKSMELESKALKDELYKFCWFMRGGLNADQAFQLTVEDREIIARIIEGNLETTKKTQLPFF